MLQTLWLIIDSMKYLPLWHVMAELIFGGMVYFGLYHWSQIYAEEVGTMWWVLVCKAGEERVCGCSSHLWNVM